MFTAPLRAAALVALALTACTREPAPPVPAGFGAAEPEYAAPGDGDPRVAPAYARAATRSGTKLAVRRTRIDAGDPAEQNWEVALELVRADPASADGDELFAAWMTGREGTNGLTATGLRFARSVDGARTFAPLDVSIPAPARHIPFDPSLAYDGSAYIGAVGQDATGTRRMWVARSLGDDAAAFAPGTLLPLPPAGGSNDKIWLAAGPQPAGAAERVLYAVDRNGAMASTDGGATWSAPVRAHQLGNLPQPLVLPDGTLGLAYYSTSNQALFARSTDLARTFAPPAPIHSFAGSFAELTGGAIPGGHRAPPTAVVARNPLDGRLFAVLADVTRRDGAEADLDVLLFESADDGATWSVPRNVTADAPALSDQFLPWLAIDAAGRLHVAWFDTRTTTGGDAAPNAAVDVWYAVSTDHGASFATQRLTDVPIATEVTRWSPLSAQPGGQFVGDYFTLVASRHAAYVAHPVLESGTVGMAVSRVDLAALGTTAIRDPRGLTGAWFDPATSGQGVELQWLAGERLLVIFYGHHDDGRNFFLVGTRDGRFGYGEAIEVPLVATTGGRYSNLDPDAIRRTPWGSVRLTFASCGAATARLDGSDGVQTMSLQRLALAPDLPCD